MRLNKVHKGIRQRTLCGANHGRNSGNIVPMSRENRDVTCKHCLRMLKRAK